MVTVRHHNSSAASQISAHGDQDPYLWEQQHDVASRREIPPDLS